MTLRSTRLHDTLRCFYTKFFGSETDKEIVYTVYFFSAARCNSLWQFTTVVMATEFPNLIIDKNLIWCMPWSSKTKLTIHIIDIWPAPQLILVASFTKRNYSSGFLDFLIHE